MTDIAISASGNTEKVNTGAIWRVGALGIIAAIVANLVVAAIAVPVLGIDAAFSPLQPPATIIVSVLFMVPAVVAFWLIAKFTSRPITTYRIVALIALVVSLIPDLGLLMNPAGAPFGGITPASVGVLMVQHVVAAAIIVWLLTTRTRES